MIAQMFGNLPFGLGNKTEGPAISECTAGRADRKCSRVPQWAESTDRCVEFAYAFFAPVQMVTLFIGGLAHVRGHGRVASDSGVSLVEGLCSDLAGMIDSHQASGMPPFSRGELRIRNLPRRIGTGGTAVFYGDGAECVIHAGQELIYG